MRRDPSEAPAQDFERGLGRMRRAMALAMLCREGFKGTVGQPQPDEGLRTFLARQRQRGDHEGGRFWVAKAIVIAVTLAFTVLAVLLVGGYLWYTDVLTLDLVQFWFGMAVMSAHRLWSEFWNLMP